MQSPIIKAIFFDIGGTLRVTHPGERRDPEKIRELMAFLGEECTEEEFIERIHRGEKAYRRWCKPNFVELPEAELWSRFLKPDAPAEFIRQHAIHLNQLWRESRRKYVLPDMVTTLRTLYQRGYKLGIISNTTSSVEGYQLIAENGLADMVSCVILSAEYGRRKPHPSLFIEAARRAGVQPQECAYVGDRPSRDLLGGLGSGYGKVVIINANGYTADENDPDDYDPEKDKNLLIRPDHFIGRLGQLLEIFPPLSLSSAPQFTGTSPSSTWYDVGISSMWWDKDNDTAEDFFSKAYQLGFVRFEMNHQTTVSMLESINLNRYYIGSLHDPCPAIIPNKQLEREDKVITSLDKRRRLFAVDVVKHTIETAHRLGARCIVLHTGRIAGDHSPDDNLREMYKRGLKDTPEYEAQLRHVLADRIERGKPHFDALMKSLAIIIPFAEDAGVMLGIENRFHHYELPSFDEMEAIFSTYQQPWVGWQFDVGHLYVENAFGLMNFDEWLESFSARMVGVHLHDVIGVVDHRAPGMGEVNFDRIAKMLPPSAMRTLEIDKSVSYADMKRGLAVLAAAGCIEVL